MMKHTHTAFVCLNSTAQPASNALTLYLSFKQACKTDTTSVEKKTKEKATPFYVNSMRSEVL